MGKITKHLRALNAWIRDNLKARVEPIKLYPAHWVKGEDGIMKPPKAVGDPQ